MSKRSKYLIIIGSIIALIGVIIGAVFGGIAIANNVKWKNLQGHDTSLIWVNINGMIAEPKHIEKDSYNYENYIVEIPNTTVLSVQSYKVGKDATGEFYYDDKCTDKVENIKSIECSDSSYVKTIYLKILSQKKDERIVKIDVSVNNFLINGTTRIANPDGHIEIPSNLNEVMIDGNVFTVIRQNNINELYQAEREMNYILAEDILLKNPINEIGIFDGNNYRLSLDKQSNYMSNIFQNDEDIEDISDEYTRIINFEYAIEWAQVLKNIEFIGFDDRLVHLTDWCSEAYQIKATNASICRIAAGYEERPSYDEFELDLVTEKVLKNIVIIQESGSNMGIATYVLGKIIFNCINYTENKATLQSIQTQKKVGVAQEKQKFVFRGGSGGIIYYSVAAKIINSYNYLDANHGWLAGGIASLASGLILHCNNYGNILMKIWATPVDTRHQDSKYRTVFWDVGNLRRSGGIVAYFGNENIRNDLSGSKKNKIEDCRNYGNIYYEKNNKKDCNQIANIGGFSKDYKQINCKEIGRIKKT